ncbi:unnamed protein product, partial [Rotaria socialis]
DGPTKIFRDLNGGLCLKTVKRWCKMISETGSIELAGPLGGSRIVRTPAAIQKGITPLVILDKGTTDHARYIKEVLPVALKYGNKIFGSDWTFQQDGAKPHTHHLSQQWCRDNFPSFIGKDRWPPHSPDLNPLDYCIWDEFNRAINWNKIISKKTLIE